MTPEKLIKERDAVKRERAAFERGVEWCNNSRMHDGDWPKFARIAATLEFRLPKVSRPRVVTGEAPEGHLPFVWSVIDGRLHYTTQHGGFSNEWLPFLGVNKNGILPYGHGMKIDAALAALWADLLARPTEEIDDDT